MSVKKPNKVVITIDLEYWYCGKFLDRYLPQDKSRLPALHRSTTIKILDLLAAKGATATFFVLAELAQNDRELIQKIKAAGHGIAVHGLKHELVSAERKDYFADQIKEAKKIIQEITGVPPRGFRAPNFSIGPKDHWALEILEENGFLYDSSFFTPPSFSLKKPIDHHFYPLNDKKFIEYPISYFRFCGFNIPISGGFYFRVIPYSIFSFLLRIKNKSSAAPILYFHPIDVESSIPDLKLPLFVKLIKFWGIKSGLKKFEKIINDFQVVSLEQSEQ